MVFGLTGLSIFDHVLQSTQWKPATDSLQQTETYMFWTWSDLKHMKSKSFCQSSSSSFCGGWPYSTSLRKKITKQNKCNKSRCPSHYWLKPMALAVATCRQKTKRFSATFPLLAFKANMKPLRFEWLCHSLKLPKEHLPSCAITHPPLKKKER